MICERCLAETFLAYGRTVFGKKVIVCYTCAKVIDKEECEKDAKSEEMENKKDIFPAVVMQITQSDISAAVSMFEEDEAEELAKIVWDAALVEKLIVKIRKTVIPYYLECPILPNAIRELVEDEIAAIKEKDTFRSGVKRFIMYMKKGRI